MSTETRIIRPYIGGEEFQRILDTARLGCADRLLESGGTVSVSLDEYLNFPFRIELPDLDEGLMRRGAEALDFGMDDVDLLVLVTAPRLRFVDIVFRKGLDRAAEFSSSIDITSGTRPRALRAPHGGADVQIYFCLNKEFEALPGRPWRRGTWLGHQQFRVRSGLSGTGFVPIRLTDEDREQFGLSKDVLRFVTLDDADPFDPDPGPEAVKLYVDGILLDRLSTAAATNMGRQLQKQLFVDAVAAIVFRTHQRMQEDPSLGRSAVDDFGGSLVHKLAEFIGGRGSDTDSVAIRQGAFRTLRDDPMHFLAEIEARTGLRKDMLASFEETR